VDGDEIRSTFPMNPEKILIKERGLPIGGLLKVLRYPWSLGYAGHLTGSRNLTIKNTV